MLVHVHTANSLPEAQVVSCTLEAAGIPHNLNGIAHASVSWMMLFALGGIRISVPEAAFEDAEQLLSETDYDVPLWEASRFRQNWLLNTVSGITWLGVGAPFLPWLLRKKDRIYWFGLFLTFLALIVFWGPFVFSSLIFLILLLS